jgi:hypothetical protein
MNTSLARAVASPSRRSRPFEREPSQDPAIQASTRTRPSLSASLRTVPLRWPHSSACLALTTITSRATSNPRNSRLRRAVSARRFDTSPGSITSRSRSEFGRDSPRAREPKRITLAPGAAAARRRLASSMRASSVTIDNRSPAYGYLWLFDARRGGSHRHSSRRRIALPRSSCSMVALVTERARVAWLMRAWISRCDLLVRRATSPTRRLRSARSRSRAA